MICEVFAVREAAVRYVTLTVTRGDRLHDSLANQGATVSILCSKLCHSLFQE